MFTALASDRYGLSHYIGPISNKFIASTVSFYYMSAVRSLPLSSSKIRRCVRRDWPTLRHCHNQLFNTPHVAVHSLGYKTQCRCKAYRAQTHTDIQKSIISVERITCSRQRSWCIGLCMAGAGATVTDVGPHVSA